MKTLYKTAFFMLIACSALFLASCDEDEIIEVAVRIIFESNGGTPIDPIDFEGELEGVWPDDPVREGHEFGGWYTDNENFKNPFDPESLVIEKDMEDITLYAWWSPGLYTITFHDTGGSTIEPMSFFYGSQTTAPDDPIGVGCTFNGWYEDEDKEIPHDFGPMPGNDVDLFGSWTKNSYDVNFDSAGGTMIPADRYEYEGQMQEPLDPVKTGHEFLGWFQTSGSETPYVFDEMPPYDLNLVARWEPLIYEVRFQTNGGSEIETMEVPYGESVTVPMDPIKSGQTFDGWFADQELTEPHVFGPMPDHDLDLYAAWTVTLSFETFDGSDVASMTEYPNTPVFEPEDPVFEDHDFHGWYADEQLTTPFVFDFMPEVHTTVYAKWLPALVTVDFVTNGGDPLDSEDMPIGTSLVSLVATKDNGVFAGWYAEETFVTRVDEVPSDPITLYARWLSLDVSTIGNQAIYYVPTGYDDDDGIDEVMGGFDMGVTEVTYPVWYEVRLWALENGYAFEHAGREGRYGADGAEPTGVLLPVTTISYRDIIVWLNALSERSGLSPVYRNISDEVIKNATNDSADSAVQADENGYRLPLRAEWNMAARLLTDPEPLDASYFTPSGYFTPGNYASGAHRAYNAFEGLETKEVSWYDANSGGVMHEVAQLRVNQMGLYDMSGNAAEFCFDFYEAGRPFVKGGGFNRGWNNMQMGHFDAYSTTAHDYGTGFRVVLNA